MPKMTRFLKYAPLTRWLENVGQPLVEASFADIAELVGGLPESALKFQQWWENSGHHSQAKAWLAAGYRIEAANRETRTVRFKKD